MIEIYPGQARVAQYADASQTLDAEALGDAEVDELGNSPMQQRQAQTLQLDKASAQWKGFSQQLSGSTEQQHKMADKLAELQRQLNASPAHSPESKQLRAKVSETISLLLQRSKLGNNQIKSLAPMLKGLIPTLRNLLSRTPQAATLLQPLHALQPELPATETEKSYVDGLSPDSDAVLFDHLVDIIDSTNKDNEIFSNMVEGFVEYYDKISKFDYTKYFSQADDKGNITVDFEKMSKDFKKIIDDASGISLGNMSQEQFDKYGEKLFGSDYNKWIQRSPDGNVTVVAYNPAVKTMMDSIVTDVTETDVYNQVTHQIDHIIKYTYHTSPLSQADSNAWCQHFDARMTEISNHSNDMAQKLSRANNVFDNLIKVLTSTINSLKDANMAFTSKL